MPTAFQLHKQKWGECTLCPLHETRASVVLVRGDIPCEVLFVGEAPGPSEDALGSPFKGPAGHLLDTIIERAIGALGIDHTISTAFTNLVACIPIDESAGGKFAEPPKESIKACAPRLDEIGAMCNPSLVVAVGALANKVLTKKREDGCKWIQGEYVHIVHPAYILRDKSGQSGLAIQNATLALEDALTAAELHTPF